MLFQIFWKDDLFLKRIKLTEQQIYDSQIVIFKSIHLLM